MTQSEFNLKYENAVHTLCKAGIITDPMLWGDVFGPTPIPSAYLKALVRQAAVHIVSNSHRYAIDMAADCNLIEENEVELWDSATVNAPHIINLIVKAAMAIQSSQATTVYRAIDCLTAREILTDRQYWLNILVEGEATQSYKPEMSWALIRQVAAYFTAQSHRSSLYVLSKALGMSAETYDRWLHGVCSNRDVMFFMIALASIFETKENPSA